MIATAAQEETADKFDYSVLEITDFNEGQVILIDKPPGWTSFNAVSKVKYACKAKKVGHAGTLDPLATGLLILCTGKFTKRISEFQNAEKEYIGEITLGGITPSFDLETEVQGGFPIEHISEDLIFKTASTFTGQIIQTPPNFSAIKVDGKRAYESARKGKNVVLEPRKVEIRLFEITKIEMPRVFFRVICSKGTYIRTLANDFGLALKSGAYLSSLRRTRIGEYSVENAVSPIVFAENCLGKIKS